jgi:dTDP-4-dehydrorhamnose reductase
MHILLFGKIGQLGWELSRTLPPLGRLTAVDYPEIDLTRPETIRGLISEIHPDIVINATAYTAVDRAESEAQIAMAINGHAPGIMAEAARSIGAALIHYSTDYVFDGTKGSPYVETDTPNPLGAYGQSKLAGERAIQQAGGVYLILRTSWLYSLRRDSFVTKVLDWARQNTDMSAPLRVVADQVGNPTWARMLAEITAQLLAKGEPLARRTPGSSDANRSLHSSDLHSQRVSEWLSDRGGLYHLAGSGYASRLEWAEAILRFDPRRDEQKVREIQPAVTSDFPTPAKRPLFSALNCEYFTKTFELQLPEWGFTLKLAMETP